MRDESRCHLYLKNDGRLPWPARPLLVFHEPDTDDLPQSKWEEVDVGETKHIKLILPEEFSELEFSLKTLDGKMIGKKTRI